MSIILTSLFYYKIKLKASNLYNFITFVTVITKKVIIFCGEMFLQKKISIMQKWLEKIKREEPAKKEVQRRVEDRIPDAQGLRIKSLRKNKKIGGRSNF